jgi:aryl-alcohol dehydrogenase-like predicted oxidoreductase
MSDMHITLPCGYTISRLIKGGWQLAGGHGAIERDRALADMAAFVAAGIDTFDCADIYTGVEALIGEFLRSRAELASGEPAPLVRVHTKCVPDLAALPTLHPSDIEGIIDRSRARLGVDALDLVQFHWWDYDRGDVIAAARTLEALRTAGKIRHIGVTNFDTPRLRALLEAGIPVVSHQLQYSLLDRRPAGPMAALCQERGVAMLAYGSVAGGFFSERWLGAPEPGDALENRSLVKYRLIIDEFGGWSRFQELLRVLDAIARRHDVRIGTVAIRWTLDQPGVAAAIVGARHAGHLEHTRRAIDLQLTDADRDEIGAAIAGASGPAGDVYALERDREGVHGRIMRYNLNTPR